MINADGRSSHLPIFTSSQKKISPSISHLVISRFRHSSDCWFSIKSSICTAKEFKLKKQNKFLCLFSTKKEMQVEVKSRGSASLYNSVNRLSLVFIQKVQLPLFSFLIYWGTTKRHLFQLWISLTRRRHDILFKPLRPKLTANPIAKKGTIRFLIHHVNRQCNWLSRVP